MNESSEALRQTIAATQEDLSRNLEALEAKGQDLVDWRAHFDKRPLAMLGVAFVGGVLAANVVSGGRSSRQGSGDTPSESAPRRSTVHRDSHDTWGRLRSGLGVVAAGVALEALSKALPGIKESVIDPVRSALRAEEASVATGGRFQTGTSRMQRNGDRV